MHTMISYDNHDNRKLRPLIPRPMPSSVTITNSTTITPPSHVHDFFARYQTTDQNHDEENKREHELNSTTASPAGSVSSSRWNPTAEQLSCLEELYRHGTRTPSAEQIRRITAQLRCYGKIEGKNVFYWFQNHKARERQKRRRQMESLPDPSDLHVQISDAILDSGTGKTRYEVEQTKNWTLHTNGSILAEESKSIRSTTAKARYNSTRTDGCFRLGKGELLQQQEEERRRSFITIERNATWQDMQLSCPAPSSNQLLNSNTGTAYSRVTTTAAMATVLTPAMEPVLINTHDPENMSTQAPNNTENIMVDRLNGSSTSRVINDQTTADQTLQLFPIECSTEGNDSSEFTQFKFFEFLPLKS